jgi:hypothetical protein
VTAAGIAVVGFVAFVAGNLIQWLRRAAVVVVVVVVVVGWGERDLGRGGDVVNGR